MAIDSTVKNPFQVSLWTACMKSIDAQLYHLVTIDVCISYNTGKSALPDILICTMPEGTQRPRASAYISGKGMSACVITNIFHLRHSKNLPKLQ